MKLKIEVDCTPEEARSFLGLPDVTALNAHLVNEMRNRIDANINLLQPDEFIKSWVTLGGAAQDQFRKMMMSAATSTMAGGGSGSPRK
jgi:hypothetical protein